MACLGLPTSASALTLSIDGEIRTSDVNGTADDDDITVSNGSTIQGSVNGLAGNDMIDIRDSQVRDDVNGGDNDDFIDLSGTTSVDRVLLGNGNNSLDLLDSATVNQVLGGAGEDQISIRSTGFNENIIFDGGGSASTADGIHDQIGFGGKGAVYQARGANLRNFQTVAIQQSTLVITDGALTTGSGERVPERSVPGVVIEFGGAIDGQDGLIIDGDLTLVGGASRFVGHGGGSGVYQATNVVNDGVIDLQDGQAGDVFKIQGDLQGRATGSGVFRLDAATAQRRNDQIQIGGAVSGAPFTLDVADSGVEPDGSEVLTLVTTSGGDGQFALAGDSVDVGAFRYVLQQEGNDWNLVNLDQPVAPVTPTDPADPTDPVVPVVPITPIAPSPNALSKGSNAALGMHTAMATLIGAEMDTLHQRQGELRFSQGENNGGVWVRSNAQEYDVSGLSSRDYRQDITSTTIGADKAIDLASGQLYVGGLMAITESDQSFGEGVEGDIDGTGAGIYATYLNPNGVYVDGVARVTHYDNEVTFTNNTGERVRGDDDSVGYSLSVEGGRQYRFAGDWVVEPQAQVILARVEGSSYRQSDGLKVDADDLDSVQTRLGVLAGKRFTLANNMVVQPYAKLSYIAELADDSEVSVNGHDLNVELPGDRLETGAGASLGLTPASRLFVDVDYAKGDDIEQPWGVNLGYRFSW